MPEAEYMRRIMYNPTITEKQAKKFYMLLWEMIVDARMRKRQEKQVRTFFFLFSSGLRYYSKSTKTSKNKRYSRLKKIVKI